MSRSFKKEPFEKDPNNGMGKRIANKKLRREVKKSIYRDNEVMPLEDEVVNYHSIVDFRISGYKTKEKADELRRK